MGQVSLKCDDVIPLLWQQSTKAGCFLFARFQFSFSFFVSGVPLNFGIRQNQNHKATMTHFWMVYSQAV